MLDFLRSCYSTSAVLTPGAPAVPIHWWFTAPGAPIAPHHRYGSLNWQKPRTPPFEVGEWPGAKRPWRDGSRPANACGGPPPPVTVHCQQFRTDWDLVATINVNGFPQSTPMQWEPPVRAYQAGHFYNFGTCQRWVLNLSCVAGDRDYLRLFAAAGLIGQPASVFDDIHLSYTDTPDIFPITISCPQIGAGCLGAGGGEVTMTVDFAPTGQARRPLPLI